MRLLALCLMVAMAGPVGAGNAAAAGPKKAANGALQQWVGTWAASPVGSAVKDGKFGAGGGDGTTLREIVHVSLGGNSVRIVLTNEFGTEPLVVGAAALAASADGAALAGAGHALTFNGAPGVTIPAGALAVSDPVAFALPPLSNLAVSLYLPEQVVHSVTMHPLANQTNYMAAGNAVMAATLPQATERRTWDFVKGVDVLADTGAGAIVTLGDSITDGANSSRNTNSRWPDVLARRLAADKRTAGLAVLNQGISGNRLLHDVSGPSALARFDRDVLSMPGVKYLIVLEGINDIGRTTQPREPGDAITTGQLLWALDQIVVRAHAHGIRVIGATLTPYEGAKYADANGEAMREAENDYIRHSGKFDGVIDFEKITRDPNKVNSFNPEFDSGDHLHPKDAGYKVMGEEIDLGLFAGR